MDEEIRDLMLGFTKIRPKWQKAGKPSTANIFKQINKNQPIQKKQTMEITYQKQSKKASTVHLNGL